MHLYVGFFCWLQGGQNLLAGHTQQSGEPNCWSPVINSLLDLPPRSVWLLQAPLLIPNTRLKCFLLPIMHVTHLMHACILWTGRAHSHTCTPTDARGVLSAEKYSGRADIRHHFMNSYPRCSVQPWWAVSDLTGLGVRLPFNVQRSRLSRQEVQRGLFKSSMMLTRELLACAHAMRWW
jgi:hypothetical protein